MYLDPTLIISRDPLLSSCELSIYVRNEQQVKIIYNKQSSNKIQYKQSLTKFSQRSIELYARSNIPTSRKQISQPTQFVHKKDWKITLGQSLSSTYFALRSQSEKVEHILGVPMEQRHLQGGEHSSMAQHRALHSHGRAATDARPQGQVDCHLPTPKKWTS
jgi:hypothetical protein